MQTARMVGHKIFCAVGEKNKVNHLQVLASFIINEHPRLTMKELADHLGITSPSATSLVDRLVKAGWVVRIADKDNRKLVRLQMAAAGKRAMNDVMKLQAKAMEEVLSYLEKDEQRDFARILHRLHSALTHDVRR